jgi:hypothetical protein
MRYDPDRPLEPSAWLDLDEGERLLMIESYHKRARVRLPSRRMHAIIHAAVETQLAEGLPPATRTLTRLMAEGLDRHDAIHALGSILAQHLFDTVKGEGPFDRNRYTQDLDRLTAEGWRHSQDDDEE